MKAKPFVKWVGGKSQLIDQLEALLPADFDQWENVTYIEPFVGGGAMLFYMLQTHSNIRQAILNDINPDLTTCYKVVRDNPSELVKSLQQIQKEYYDFQSEEDRKSFFLKRRDEFNTKALDPIRNTTLFFFLNRTCFNGLYRVNKAGLFNVPFGRYETPMICDPNTIYADSELLQNVEILTGDYQQTLSKAKDNTLFYFDPPYRPLSNTSSFNDYAKEAFNDNEQKRLKEFCDLVTQNGYTFLLSNSDGFSHNNDTFFDDLYARYTIYRVNASRMFNANPNKRGKLSELVVTNSVLPDYIPVSNIYSSYNLMGKIVRKIPIEDLRIDKSRLSFANEILEDTVETIVYHFDDDWWLPIFIDKDYCLRDGQHRLVAAKRMGLRFIDALLLNEEHSKIYKYD